MIKLMGDDSMLYVVLHTTLLLATGYLITTNSSYFTNPAV